MPVRELTPEDLGLLKIRLGGPGPDAFTRWEEARASVGQVDLVNRDHQGEREHRRQDLARLRAAVPSKIVWLFEEEARVREIASLDKDEREEAIRQSEAKAWDWLATAPRVREAGHDGP